MPHADKEEQKAYRREWYRRNAEPEKKRIRERKQAIIAWFRELRSTLACVICGENHPACLDFHHIDDEKKDGCVTRMVHNGLSKDKILAEMAKCQVLCSNCHRKIHWS